MRGQSWFLNALFDFGALVVLLCGTVFGFAVLASIQL